MSTLNPVGMDTTTGQFKIAQSSDTLLAPGNIALSGVAPSIAAGTGAGTSPTISISGVNNGGIVTVTTGTLPTGSNATIVTITYSTAFPNSSAVTLTSANASTAALSGSGNPFPPPSSSTGFSIQSGITSLIGSTTYKWSYTVLGW